MSSPVPRYVRRTGSSCSSERRRESSDSGTTDARWSLLDLVRRSRNPLGIRDRDVTVLRGLLSLLPPSTDPGSLVVFASNRVLIERCDGIDERTLRRRLGHLAGCGLLARTSSPNGKRYQVRDECADVKLTYGIDLSPLFALRDHLAALAEQCAREEVRRKALRSVIRDILYHHSPDILPELTERAYRSLRRCLSSEQLEEIVDLLRATLPPKKQQDASVATVLSASDSQNDRHIQRSNKKDYELEAVEAPSDADHRTPDVPSQRSENSNDISVHDCMAMAKSAAAFTVEPLRSWDDVIRLSSTLAPALGLQRVDVDVARRTMGPLGSALAILGLLESFDKIRSPRAYLRALCIRTREESLDFVRMFRSLTKARVSGVSVGCAI